MRRAEAVLTSTRVDKHGERLTRDDLVSMVEAFNRKYITIETEHDPRLPPRGRVVSAKVVEQDDGQSALRSVLEFWDESDTPESLHGDGRRIENDAGVQGAFEVHYDRSFLDPEGEVFVHDLARLSSPSAEPIQDLKKAAEPISTLVIAAGAFVLGGIANGFFGKIGEDIFDALKRKLKAWFRRSSSRDRLLILQFPLISASQVILVQSILENPRDEDIETLLSQGLGQLDSLTVHVVTSHERVSRVVTAWRHQRLELLYWVRDDGVPSVILPPTTLETPHGVSLEGSALFDAPADVATPSDKAGVMFRNEREFVDFVEMALRRTGHEVQREVPVGGRHRLDLLATADGVRKGVEAKFTARGLLDDLAKSQALLRLSEVDEMYVCGPKVFMSEDVLALSTSLGVGLLAVSDVGELHWLVKSKRLKPARLTLAGGYSAVVYPGGEARYHAAVFNMGEKTAVSVEVSMVPAGAFSAPKKSKARARRATIEGGEKWEVDLACKVKKGTRPGKHPLMLVVRAANAERENSTVHYEVREVGS